MEKDSPTELTLQDIEKAFQIIKDYEIKEKKCTACGKGFYLQVYGYMFGECDECYFSRWSKEEVEKFCRGFFDER
jgi:hypothetical protein